MLHGPRGSAYGNPQQHLAKLARNMTVEELIEQLKHYRKDAKVVGTLFADGMEVILFTSCK